MAQVRARTIEDDGERMIPKFHHDALIYAEHLVRYIFASALVRGKRVLDLGCGVGYGTDMLKSAGATEVVGIDRSIEAITYGRERHADFQPDYLLADAESLPLRDQQFDVVVSFETLEHVVDYRHMLAEAKRVMRPGGLLILSTPNKGVYMEGNPHHTKEFTFTELEEDLTTRFEHVGIFPQDNWITSAILSPSTMERADKPIGGNAKIFKTVGRPAGETLYIVALCSDAPLPKVSQQVAMTDIVEMRRYMEEIGRLTADIHRISKDVVKRDAVLVQRDALLADKDAALAQKDNHIADIEAALVDTEAQLRDVQMQHKAATSGVGYRLLERIRSVIRRLAPEGTRRRGLFSLFIQGLRIILTEGLGTFLWRAAQVWKWAPRRIRRGMSTLSVWPLDDQYQLWLKAHALTPVRARRIGQQARRLAYQPLVSIVMPVYNPEPTWLREAIESVRAQLYENWELCIADDGSTRPEVREVLEEYPRADRRVKVTRLEKNRGIVAASNAGLAMASGEFVSFLDHDDELKPEALFEVVRLLNEKHDLDFIYSDEDKKDSDGRLAEPFFKPDWSPDLLMSVNYVTHFSVFRKELVDSLGGFRRGYDGSQDYDLVLRVTEKTDRIAHIAKPLYTWRKAAQSAASSEKVKPFAKKAAKKALKEALKRRGLRGEVLNGLWISTYRIRYGILGEPLVSIIVPTRDRVQLLARCIDSIQRKTGYKTYEILVVDNGSVEESTHKYLKRLAQQPGIQVLDYPQPFNFSTINNFAARHAQGEHLLFLNNDTEVISEEWLSALLEHSQRPEVGAVGARLLYTDGRLQHGGVIIGLGGVAGHAHKLLPKELGGYFARAKVIQNFSAVTAACLMIRADLFADLGGFDEEHLAIAFGDVDLCLRIRERGLLVVWTPYAELYHHESTSRGYEDTPEKRRRFGREIDYMKNKWGDTLVNDPYYNPNLTLDREDFSLGV